MFSSAFYCMVCRPLAEWEPHLELIAFMKNFQNEWKINKTKNSYRGGEMGDGKIVDHENVSLRFSVKMLKYSLALFHFP